MRTFATLALLAPLARAYILTDDFFGAGFFEAFTWENISDPTHGRVNYLDERTSIKDGLAFATLNSFVMRVDDQTVLDPKGPGRNSIRIRSKKTWQHGVSVLDVRHMPQGCSTWPAFWSTTEDGWPTYGEIDIIEGVNDQSPNAITLHTTPNCTIPTTGPFTGTAVSDNCDTSVNGNEGCSIHASGSNSYGPPFNKNGGGIYVTERTSAFVKVWFFPRGSWTPLELALPSPILDTGILGKPQAYFPNTDCDLDAKLSAHNLIFDTTLCGDWAGQASVYNSSGCPSDCVTFVNENPSAFTNAYWDIASLRVYQ